MALTAFKKHEERLRRELRFLRIDEESLERPIKQCELGECAGTCCHDGVYLADEEVEVLFELCDEESTRLRLMGIDLSEDPIIREKNGDWRTRTVPRDMPARTASFPKHFPQTACVFLMEDARCALQAIAMEQGHHPWHYKPLPCWLHPLTFAGGRWPKLFLPTIENDPQTQEDYPGFAAFSNCGKTCKSGRPAKEVLAEELEFLQKIKDGIDS